jgi:putative FmdB family regulatory protein
MTEIPVEIWRTEGGKPMPTYDFRCTKCRKDFSVTLTLKEREKGKMKCPACNSSKQLQPIFTSFFAKTSKKS